MKLHYFFSFFTIIFCAMSSATTNQKTAHYLDLASIELLFEQQVGQLVVLQILQNIDIAAKITPFPAVRAEHLVKSARKDGEIMRIWSYGEEHSGLIRVKTPYYELKTMAFMLRDSQIHIKHKADLAHYTLAKIKGVKHTNNITEGLTQLYDVFDTQSMFKLLAAGKVDVVLTNSLDGLINLRGMENEAQVISSDALARLPLYLYLQPQHKTLADKINREIIRLTRSGELASMILNAEQQVISDALKVNRD